MQGEVRAGRREGVRGGGASGMHGEGPIKAAGGQGTRGAHPEHPVHVRDLGGVEAERLIERRPLPSRREGHMPCDAGRGAGREAGGCGVATAQAACTGGRPDSRLGRAAGHKRRAHLEHPAHDRDLGGVKAQRLVERRRVLPSRREGHAMRGEVRAGRVCGGRKRHARGRPDSRLGGRRARAERTSNMYCITVTLEVSKLSGWLNAGACCRVEGRGICDAGRGAGREAGGCEAAAAQVACTGEGPTQGVGIRARAGRTANM